MSWQAHPELKFFVAELDDAAIATGLDSLLVAGVVLVESGGYTYAYRYEPKFWERHQMARQPAYANQNPRRWAASYGLMQIMAPTARELGHTRIPEELFQPAVGLRYGCLHLKRCLDWAGQWSTKDKDVVVSGLAAYNGGRSAAQKPPTPLGMAYSLRVLKAMGDLT